MCSQLVYDTKFNEHYREGETPTPKSDMKNHLLIPLIDRSNYNKQWVQDQINSQLAEPWRKENDAIKEELNKVLILHNRRSCTSTDKFYEVDSNITVSWKDKNIVNYDRMKTCQ